MSLKDRTIFITGATAASARPSYEAAREGAKIIIAAKTAEFYPRLPGTIYTAAEEIEAAGGQALPCIVDVRDEASVQAAVQAGVEAFGGIDILVNNASATPPDPPDVALRSDEQRERSGDLPLFPVRLPQLLQSDHPHILNISLPLTLNLAGTLLTLPTPWPRWA